MCSSSYSSANTYSTAQVLDSDGWHQWGGACVSVAGSEIGVVSALGAGAGWLGEGEATSGPGDDAGGPFGLHAASARSSKLEAETARLLTMRRSLHWHTVRTRAAPAPPGPGSLCGKGDPERGVRQFVVGTGGYGRYFFRDPPLPNSEVRDFSTYGVLVLRLFVGRYEWDFVPVAGGTFTDAGSAACHP